MYAMTGQLLAIDGISPIKACVGQFLKAIELVTRPMGRVPWRGVPRLLAHNHSHHGSERHPNGPNGQKVQGGGETLTKISRMPGKVRKLRKSQKSESPEGAECYERPESRACPEHSKTHESIGSNSRPERFESTKEIQSPEN